MWILWSLAAAASVCLAVSLYCYMVAFYSPPRKPKREDVLEIPEGEIYEVFRGDMENWILTNRSLPRQEVSITSDDGLKLWGTYYEYAPGAPIELMFHGYRGNAERDLSGGVERCFRLGRSVLVVDQRCCGRSEGRTITFGIREHRDCLRWLDFMLERFGPDVKIILTGVSMGAATVLMAGGCDLPPNVIGILADCGYSSARDIMADVMKNMGVPSGLGYPFVKLGARLFGGFDPDETSPVEAVKRCKVPMIFYHGETDDFVPCAMSRKNFEACVSRKALVTIPGAGHGLCYPVARDRYVQTLGEFFGPEASWQGDVPAHAQIYRQTQ